MEVAVVQVVAHTTVAADSTLVVVAEARAQSLSEISR
jgi:hypothetical protein